MTVICRAIPWATIHTLTTQRGTLTRRTHHTFGSLWAEPLQRLDQAGFFLNLHDSRRLQDGEPRWLLPNVQILSHAAEPFTKACTAHLAEKNIQRLQRSKHPSPIVDHVRDP
jgi:hypothetical protein